MSRIIARLALRPHVAAGGAFNLALQDRLRGRGRGGAGGWRETATSFSEAVFSPPQTYWQRVTY